MLEQRKMANINLARISLAIVMTLVMLMVSSLDVHAAIRTIDAKNAFDRLHVPAQVIRIGDSIYITDCYHDQVISSKTLTSFKDWDIVASKLSGPHSIAGNGHILVVTDTENNAVRVYTRSGNISNETQIIPGVGIRPHYVSYIAEEGLFYVWSSMTGEMYRFRESGTTGMLELYDVKVIPELYGMYVRSFTVSGDYIILPCATLSSIYIVHKDQWNIVNTLPVSHDIAGMVQVIQTQYGFLMTISTDIHERMPSASIIWADSLESISRGDYVNVSPLFGEGNRPYYVSAMDGAYYACVIKERGSGLYRFQVTSDGVTGVTEILNK